MSSQESQPDMFPDEPTRELLERVKEGIRKAKIIEANRNQLILRAIDIEKLVGPDADVRAIWEFVCNLDLQPFYDQIESQQGEAGRPAVDPRILISLWIFAYSEGINSAREIAKRCEYHPCYQWLTGMEVINYHTISDFRTCNKETVDKLFAEILAALTHQELITLETVAHDGSKIKANAKGASFHRKATLEEHLEIAKQHLENLDEAQTEESLTRVEAAALRAAKEKSERVKNAISTLKEFQKRRSGKDRDKVRVSETDPEAKVMKQADGGFAPSYNVQVSADVQHGLIVGVGVSQSGNDRHQLSSAMERIQENLGKAPDQVLVDSDFVSRQTVVEMTNTQTQMISPELIDRKNLADRNYEKREISKEFRSEAFSYNPENDTVTCPAEKVLSFTNKERKPGITRFYYKAQIQDCSNCPFKQRCCPQTEFRTVSRIELDQAVQDFNTKMQSPEVRQIYKKRSVIEFVFAWFKEKMRIRQFRLRGQTKVTIEMVWASIAFNIKQWIRIVWKKPQPVSN